MGTFQVVVGKLTVQVNGSSFSFMRATYMLNMS